jgi:hypothetical protein
MRAPATTSAATAPEAAVNRRQRLLAWGAPALLVAVAASQFWLAHARNLSAWKGGGFGMFSTVDSPGGRFLRIYLVTPRGEMPVALPPALAPLALECRTLPSAGRLGRLAGALAAGRWVPYELASAVAHYQALGGAEGARAGGDLAAPAAGAGARPATGDLPGERGLVRLGILRMQGQEEPPGASAVAFSAVRVELWRQAFAASERRLHARRLLAASAPAGGGR